MSLSGETMKSSPYNSLLFVSLLLFSQVLLSQENLRTPNEIIRDLQDKLYVIGETSGKYEKFIEAEENAVSRLQEFMKSGDSEELVRAGKSGVTPLMNASFMGYSSIVEEMLKSEKVRQSINATDSKGWSAWTNANFAFRQAAWVCNPKIFESPFAYVPILVTQPYYTEYHENRYKNIRTQLEKNGAKADMKGQIQIWNETCKNQTDEFKSKVDETDDLLDLVLKEGEAVLTKLFNSQ